MFSYRSISFSRNFPKSKTLLPQRRLATASTFQGWRALSKMATPRKVHLTVNDTGILKFRPQTAETAAKISELLQENHDKYHIFFNSSGFHNHIVHHLLSLYGLGASSSDIERHYKNNLSYQRPVSKIEERVVQDMSNQELFKNYLGKPKYYEDFLRFWQDEMEKKGWENVLNEYVFAGDERADDMLTRLYAGFLHPIIHLGFGIEFHQPAIIAEALAQAAIHDNWMKAYLLTTEAISASKGNSTKNLPQLIDEIHDNEKLANSVHWGDSNNIRDGILKRAPDEMIGLASQWTFATEPDERELEKKTAEMINACVYFTIAAQRPPKQIKFDFFSIHSLNSSLFFPTLNAQPWLSQSSKARLLKLKAYVDLAMYCSRGSPALLMDEIEGYKVSPSSETPGESKSVSAYWSNILPRLNTLRSDDGHAVKLGRAVAVAETVCAPFEGEKWARIKGSMWEKVGYMVLESVDGVDEGNHWVRGSGFDEGWEGVGDRVQGGKL